MHNQKSTGAVRQVIQVIFQPLLFEVYFGPPLLHQALHFSKAPALTFMNWLFSALQSPPNARVQIFFEPQMLADFSSLYLTAQIFRHHALLITKRDSCIFFDLCQYQLSFFSGKIGRHQREWGTRYIVCVPMYISWCPHHSGLMFLGEKSSLWRETQHLLTHILTVRPLDGDGKGGDCKYISARYLESQTYNKEK